MERSWFALHPEWLGVELGDHLWHFDAGSGAVHLIKSAVDSLLG